jgi:hypothetical protein
MKLESEFMIARVREILGPACEAPLQLVSKKCLALVPRQDLRVEHFVSTVSLFVWARQELRMPRLGTLHAARGGNLEVLKVRGVG